MMFRRIADVASSLIRNAISPFTEAATAVDEARDAWSTYPRANGPRRTLIVCNEGYARVAKTDRRDHLLKVSMQLKHPTQNGLAGAGEVAALAELDDALENALARLGAVPVGHVTADSARHAYYYYASTENTCADLARKTAEQHGYAADTTCTPDAEKNVYWQELYPTRDERQTIRDLKVLANLRQYGDIASKPREVTHWAYFADAEAAQAFGEWATANQYKLIIGAPAQQEQIGVKFSHVGAMALDDITRRTIAINRKATELNGEYDGWETSVER